VLSYALDLLEASNLKDLIVVSALLFPLTCLFYRFVEPPS
jgi:hypothetical protein